MESAIADFTSKYNTIFEGDCLELYAKAHQDKTKINEGPRSPNLFLHYKKEEKNPAKKTSVPPVKVIIADDEEEPRIPTKARCSLEFRPVSGYIGDYGFDWIRKGDTAGAPGYHNDYDFKENMGKHYYAATNKVETNGNKTGDSFKYDKDINSIVLNPDTNLLDDSFGKVLATDDWGRMFDRLRKRYRKIVFPWNDTVTGKPFETCAPIMTLMNGKTANLTLQIDIQTQPQKIVFVFNNSNADSFFEIKIDTVSTKEITSNLSSSNTSHTMEIKCTGEFDDEYTLCAQAFGQNDPKGEICGMLRILPNGQMYQHKIKVAFIGVTTDINPPISPVTGVAPSPSTQNLLNILGQALLIPEIDSNPSLDLTPPSLNFNNYCTQIGGVGPFVIDYSKRADIKTLLLDKLHSDYAGKYDFYYKIFYFAEDCSSPIAGFSMGEKFTICFQSINTDNALAVHELLHSLELPHTFDGYSRNTKFTYEFIKTDNIMDYADVYPPHPIPKSLYHWQWQIINLKIR